MGTTQSRKEKVGFVLDLISKIREKETEINRIELEAELMIKKACSKKTAVEIVQSLIDSGRVKEKDEVLR